MQFLLICSSIFLFWFISGCLIFFCKIKWTVDVAEETSPDGKYRVVFQEREAPDWPFGSAHARVTLYEGSQVIERFDEDVATDGVHFNEYHYSVYWKEDEVAINFFGEQAPVQRVIPLED